MKKIVFINPWLLFISFWVVGIVSGLIIIVAENHITRLSGLISGYFASLLMVWFQLFWPHATYKYLAKKPENSQHWNSKIFDWPMVFIVTLIPAFMVMSAYMEGVEISKSIYFLMKIAGGVTLLVLFVTLFAMLWGIAKMLKGGIGWCLALFYWPLLAVFVQSRIKELYFEIETN